MKWEPYPYTNTHTYTTYIHICTGYMLEWINDPSKDIGAYHYVPFQGVIKFVV